MKPVLSVGYNKDSEMDFSIKTEVMYFSNGEMKDFRAMTMVAIGVAEDMWRRAKERQDPPEQNKDAQ